MGSRYPAILDNFVTTRTDATPLGTTHAVDHDDLNDAINKIEAELGVNPKGVFASLSERLSIVMQNTPTVDYTLVLTDAGKIVEVNKATAAVVTIPPNSSVAFPIGTTLEVVQIGAGQVSFSSGAGVTIRSPSNQLSLNGVYSSASLRKRATDEWVLFGDLALVSTTKSTPVATISLASHGVPSTRTNHTIKIRARTTTGSTGVIKAALYEGIYSRSFDLTSIGLTNFFADYTLVISDALATTITDYSNLSIKLWGYDSAGNALTFEVSSVKLNLPAAVVGAAKATPVAEISLASHATPGNRLNHSIKVRARTTTGSTGKIRAALYEGATNRSGDLESTTLTNILADYTLPISQANATAISSYANLSIRVWGYDATGNALVFEIAKLNLNLPV